MKKTLLALGAGFMLGVLTFFCTGAGSPDNRGMNFCDSTGTNCWTWSATGPAPVMTYLGTTYTGATTNIAFTRNGVTNTLVVVNGIVTGIQ